MPYAPGVLAKKLLLVVAMLVAGRAGAYVEDLQITEHVRHSELIIVASIRERGSSSAELDVVEVLKGTNLARVTVDLPSSFVCDMSRAVPKRGQGLFFLSRSDGRWLITHFGRGFIEHEPDSDVGTMRGGIIFPRAWLASVGHRNGVRWSVMLDEVRRLIAGRRVFPDAGWTMERVECNRCNLEPVVTRLRDAGVFDWGRAEEKMGEAWLRDRMLSAQRSGRTSMGALVTASLWERREQIVDEATLLVLSSDGGATAFVSERTDAGLEPGCWAARVSTFSCAAVSAVEGGWLRCESPTEVAVCTPASTVARVEVADSSRVRCQSDRCSVDGEGWALGDLGSSGVCRSSERGLWCTLPDGGAPVDEVIAGGSW